MPRSLFANTVLAAPRDQQSTLQGSQPEGASTGCVRRMSDLAQNANTNEMFTASDAIRNAAFLSGKEAVPYKLAGNGANLIRPQRSSRLYGSSLAADALDTIVRMGMDRTMAGAGTTSPLGAQSCVGGSTVAPRRSRLKATIR